MSNGGSAQKAVPTRGAARRRGGAAGAPSPNGERGDTVGPAPQSRCGLTPREQSARETRGGGPTPRTASRGPAPQDRCGLTPREQSARERRGGGPTPRTASGEPRASAAGPMRPHPAGAECSREARREGEARRRGGEARRGPHPANGERGAAGQRRRTYAASPRGSRVLERGEARRRGEAARRRGEAGAPSRERRAGSRGPAPQSRCGLTPREQSARETRGGEARW